MVFPLFVEHFPATLDDRDYHRGEVCIPTLCQGAAVAGLALPRLLDGRRWANTKGNVLIHWYPLNNDETVQNSFYDREKPFWKAKKSCQRVRVDNDESMVTVEC